MKYLILLNRRFPFKYGEAFLENEIDEISSYFDHIVIYPSDVCLKDTQNRKIASENVYVRVIEHKSIKLRKLLYFCESIRYVNKSNESKLIKKIIDGYFLAAANIQEKNIEKDLESFSINSDDTVYLYSYWLYINAKVACLLKKYFAKKGIKTITFSRAHRFDIYEENRKFSYLPERINLLKSLDHIFACSDNGSYYLKSHYPIFDNKISTSYLGTYNHGLGTLKSRNQFHIVSCSRLSNVKRVDFLIDALKLLKNEKLSLTWTHLGGGELYEEIKEKAKALNWMEVHLNGAISNPEVYSHYVNFPEHVFINVSSSEGLPVSIMEAISFGIPVIATNVGGTKEIVLNNINGKLLDVNVSPEELASEIKKMATLPETEYHKMRTNAREIWEKNFQAPINYKRFAHEILALDEEGNK